MKIDSSNERYSMIIAGILIISVLAIFGAFALGVEGANNFSDNSDRSVRPINAETQYMLESNNSEKILDKVIRSKPGRVDMSVAHSGEVEDLETETGSLEIMEFNYDIPVPLCLTNEELSNWNIIVKSYGGYVPIKWWADQEAEIYQGKSFIWFWCYDKKVGTLEISWEDISDTYPDGGCADCYTYWNGTFSLECGAVICLDSSKYPVIEDNADGTWEIDKIEGSDIGCCNDVKITITSDWKPSCGLLSCSRFELILAKK